MSKKGLAVRRNISFSYDTLVSKNSSMYRVSSSPTVDPLSDITLSILKLESCVSVGAVKDKGNPLPFKEEAAVAVAAAESELFLLR